MGPNSSESNAAVRARLTPETSEWLLEGRKGKGKEEALHQPAIYCIMRGVAELIVAPSGHFRRIYGAHK